MGEPKDKKRFLRCFDFRGKEYYYYDLRALGETIGIDMNIYPISARIILENLIRNQNDGVISFSGIETVAKGFQKGSKSSKVKALEIPFYPSRVILQDFTGVPVLVDLASLRNVAVKWGAGPHLINPSIPVHLIIDHSLQVDVWGSEKAVITNMEKEFSRNEERYRFLKWAQSSFNNFFVVPPGKGIIHQINLENLATAITTKFDSEIGGMLVFPDTVLGTDSHTTMINGIGILGWGIGGIEAEAVMVGQPYYFPLPEVLGVLLKGSRPPQATATDVALLITQKLRQYGVVGKIVEFFGPGCETLSLPDRATIANMSPEYGATMGYFPIDGKTIDFLKGTGRSSDLTGLIEHYGLLQSFFGFYKEPEKILFSNILEIDLSEAVPSISGPRRPQDRRPLAMMAGRFKNFLIQPRTTPEGYGLAEQDLLVKGTVEGGLTIGHGAVVLASITSCTNTSNPELVILAALVARKARLLGLKVKPWVKTSFAPGSRAVRIYLENCGLLKDLEYLGFHIVGYGCATCIGNSGPLKEEVLKAVKENNLVVCAVISANRNFEGRVHSAVRANFLASPPLVVAYALSGYIDTDWEKEALGFSPSGHPVFLKDLLPSREELEEAVKSAKISESYGKIREDLFEGDDLWKNLPVDPSPLFPWQRESTYLRMPSFIEDLPEVPPPAGDIEGARVLLLLGDSVTTDHISPAGSIPEESDAGRYLKQQGVAPNDFNSYGSRRGNHEVMVRGTFANIRLKNKLVPDKTGGWTIHWPDGNICSVWEASERYRKDKVPLLVIAGKEYGTGSSRDWAAKGTALLGVKAVIAESFERIHRSNLVGMGVLPLQFMEGQSAESLGLDGREIFSTKGIREAVVSGKARESLTGGTITVEARKSSGEVITFPVKCRLDTAVEVEYFLHGGILPKVLRHLVKA